MIPTETLIPLPEDGGDGSLLSPIEPTVIPTEAFEPPSELREPFDPLWVPNSSQTIYYYATPTVLDRVIRRANANRAFTYVVYIPAGNYVAPIPIPQEPPPVTSGYVIRGRVVLRGVDPIYYKTPQRVTIDSSVDNPFRLFFVEPNARLILHNIRLRNFKSRGVGGTIYNLGDLYLYNSAIVGSQSALQGGAIYNASGGNLYMINAAFNGNRAQVGGAIASLGTIWDPPFPNDYCLSFVSNQATVNGGAVYVETSTAILNRAIYQGNQSPIYRDIENSALTPIGTVRSRFSYWTSSPSVSPNVNISGQIINPVPPPPLDCITPLPPSPTLDQYGILNNSLNDTFTLLAGVEKTALALWKMYGGNSPVDAFKRVMFLPGFTTIVFERGGNPTWCEVSNIPVLQIQSRITCRPSAIITEYTVVHELGHVLMGRTGGYLLSDPNYGNVSSFYGHLLTTTLQDTSSFIYFGFFTDLNGRSQWGRGTRGWGSSSNPFTNGAACHFQQNPRNDVNIITSQEIDEAGADMFLNWVYRSLNLGGFQNVDWTPVTGACSLQGSVDWFATGDGRWYKMQSVMCMLGKDRSWFPNQGVIPPC